MEQNPDVIVIGGGISGTATTYELARRGHRVVLLERGEIASMASGWTLAGVRQSGRHPAELPLAIAAVRRWETLAEELGTDVEYRQRGNLRLARTDDDVPVIQGVVRRGADAGLPIEYIEGAGAVREIAPGLAPAILGASFCATDGHANNHLAVRAYADAASRLGASIRPGVHVEALAVDGNRITGVVTRSGTIPAGAVVVAAGIHTPRLLAPLGLELPVEVVLCPVVQTEAAELALGPVLGVADGTFAGRQEASGRYRLIGRWEPWRKDHPSGSNTLPTMRHATEMMTAIFSYLPDVAGLRINRLWGGLIDRTPDALPVLDRVPGYEGLIVGAGFSGHGFGIGPVTGEILADLAMEGSSRFDLTPFALARFAEGSARRQALLMHG